MGRRGGLLGLMVLGLGRGSVLITFRASDSCDACVFMRGLHG